MFRFNQSDHQTFPNLTSSCEKGASFRSCQGVWRSTFIRNTNVRQRREVSLTPGPNLVMNEQFNATNCDKYCDNPCLVHPQYMSSNFVDDRIKQTNDNMQQNTQSVYDNTQKHDDNNREDDDEILSRIFGCCGNKTSQDDANKPCPFIDLDKIRQDLGALKGKTNFGKVRDPIIPDKAIFQDQLKLRERYCKLHNERSIAYKIVLEFFLSLKRFFSLVLK